MLPVHPDLFILPPETFPYCLNLLSQTPSLLETVLGAGEMAQWLRALTALPDGPELNSQQPHGGSQPYVMGSNAFFWCF